MPSFLNNIDLPDLSGNISRFTGPQQLFVALALLFIFLYGLSVGKTRAVISLLGIYVAFMLSYTFPFMQQVANVIPGNQEGYMLSIIFFLIAYVGVFLLLNHSALKSKLTIGEMSFWKVLMVSVLQVGFLSAIIMSSIPLGELPTTLQAVYPLFGTVTALFFWALASLAVLPFMKEGKRRSSSAD